MLAHLKNFYRQIFKSSCPTTNDSLGFHSWHQMDHNSNNLFKAWLSPETFANLEDEPRFPPVQIEIQPMICIGVDLSAAPLAAFGHLLWPSKGQCWKLCCRPRSWDVLLHCHCPTHQVRGTTCYGGVRRHIRAFHTSRNQHSLHFDWRISGWIPHQTC